MHLILATAGGGPQL